MSHALATWAFEVVKASRVGFDALFSQYQRNLSGQDEEAEVGVDDVLNVFHRACDVVDGKAASSNSAAKERPTTQR